MAAEKTGISSTVISNMLPIVTTLLGSYLSNNVAAGKKLTDVVGQFTNASPGGLFSAVKGLASKMVE